LFPIMLIRLVADRVAPSAFHAMAVVIEHFFERPKVNDCLIALEARPFFSLKRLDGDRAELDALDGPPRFLIALEDLNAVEIGVVKCHEETLLGERAADAAA